MLLSENLILYIFVAFTSQIYEYIYVPYVVVIMHQFIANKNLNQMRFIRLFFAFLHFYVYVLQELFVAILNITEIGFSSEPIYKEIRGIVPI